MLICRVLSLYMHGGGGLAKVSNIYSFIMASNSTLLQHSRINLFTLAFCGVRRSDDYHVPNNHAPHQLTACRSTLHTILNVSRTLTSAFCAVLRLEYPRLDVKHKQEQERPFGCALLQQYKSCEPLVWWVNENRKGREERAGNRKPSRKTKLPIPVPWKSERKRINHPIFSSKSLDNIGGNTCSCSKILCFKRY